MTASCDTSKIGTIFDWQLLSVGDFLPAQKDNETQSRLSQEFHKRVRRCSIAVGEQTFSCEWAFERSYAETYTTLQSHDTELLIAVESRPLHTKATERGWWEYTGDARWLAWGIEHDILISIFQNLLAVKLQPTNTAATPKAIESRTSLRWRFISDTARFEGTALVDETLLACLLTSNQWINDVPQNLRWQLQSTLSIEIAIGEIPVSELVASGTGDLLLIGNTHAVHDRVTVRWVSSDLYWVATAKAQRYTLCSAPLKQSLRKSVMANEQYTPPTQTEDSVSHRKDLLSVEQLQVQLALQLGEVGIPLGELEQLQPGYVIALPQSPTHLTPTILANGQAIGRGELVTLGNQLGVRITEWAGNGL